MLTDRQINRCLATSAAGAIGGSGFSVSLEETCQGLIQAANAHGGFDDVTVVLVQVADNEEMT